MVTEGREEMGRQRIAPRATPQHPIRTKARKSFARVNHLPNRIVFSGGTDANSRPNELVSAFMVLLLDADVIFCVWLSVRAYAEPGVSGFVKVIRFAGVGIVEA